MKKYQRVASWNFVHFPVEFFNFSKNHSKAKLNPEMQKTRIPAPRRKNVARIRPAARPGFERRPAVPTLRASPQILLSFSDAANPQTCWFQELPPVRWRGNDKNRSGQANNKVILQGTWILCALLGSILKCSCLLRLAGLPLILDFHICVTPAALKASLSGGINSASFFCLRICNKSQNIVISVDHVADNAKKSLCNPGGSGTYGGHLMAL